MSNSDDPLFDRVVELCGFSAYVGPGAVRRSLSEAGCTGKASADDYRKALPSLKRRLEVYVPEEEAQARIQEIERLLDGKTKIPTKSSSVGMPVVDDETQWGKRRFGKSVAILQRAREGLDSDPDPDE